MDLRRTERFGVETRAVWFRSGDEPAALIRARAGPQGEVYRRRAPVRRWFTWSLVASRDACLFFRRLRTLRSVASPRFRVATAAQVACSHLAMGRQSQASLPTSRRNGGKPTRPRHPKAARSEFSRSALRTARTGRNVACESSRTDRSRFASCSCPARRACRCTPRRVVLLGVYRDRCHIDHVVRIFKERSTLSCGRGGGPPVELRGLEPLTLGLQSRCSPS